MLGADSPNSAHVRARHGRNEHIAHSNGESVREGKEGEHKREHGELQHDFQAYAYSEGERIRNSLAHIQYHIDEPGTLSIVVGRSERLERVSRRMESYTTVTAALMAPSTVTSTYSVASAGERLEQDSARFPEESRQRRPTENVSDVNVRNG